MTDRQRTFLDAYFADPRRNATRAAALAGYSWPGKQGSRLRSTPEIARVIRAESERRAAAAREAFARRLAEEEAVAEREWLAANPWHRDDARPPPLTKRQINRRRRLWGCM